MVEYFISHISCFLEENKTLTSFQLGFRGEFSTATRLVTTIREFAESIGSHGQTDVILINFSKAFDGPPHK